MNVFEAVGSEPRQGSLGGHPVADERVYQALKLVDIGQAPICFPRAAGPVSSGVDAVNEGEGVLPVDRTVSG